MKSQTILLYNKIGSVGGLSHNSFLFLCFFLLMIFKRNKDNKLSNTNYTFLATLLVGIIYPLLSMLGTYDKIYPSWDCDVIFYVTSAFFYLLKFFIWNYGLSRLDAIFSHYSSFEYSKKITRNIRIVFVIEYFCLIAALLQIKAYRFAPSPFFSICRVIPKSGIMRATAILDFVSQVFVFLLFYNKLRQLTKIGSKISQNKDTKVKPGKIKEIGEITFVVQKYTILLGISLIMSLVLLILISKKPPIQPFYAGIDIIFGLWCFLLFDKKTDGIFRFLFSHLSLSKLTHEKKLIEFMGTDTKKSVDPDETKPEGVSNDDKSKENAKAESTNAVTVNANTTQTEHEIEQKENIQI